MDAARKGVILFGHGSRDPEWRRPMEAVAARVAARAPVRCAYLELQAPTLAQAVDALVAEGVGRVVVIPMFLGAGRHAREDLPRLAGEIRARLPALALEVRPAVGEDSRLLDLLGELALE